jgi:hypothetical protein
LVKSLAAIELVEAQKLLLELEIHCSIQLNYGRRISRDMRLGQATLYFSARRRMPNFIANASIGVFGS